LNIATRWLSRKSNRRKSCEAEIQVNALCRVEGNFRGSPVKLEHRFTMAGKKIQPSEIVEQVREGRAHHTLRKAL